MPRGTVKLRRCSGDAVEIQWKYCANTAQMQCKQYGNTVELLSRGIEIQTKGEKGEKTGQDEEEEKEEAKRARMGR